MNIHKIELSTGQKMCLVDQFFNSIMLKKVHEVFESFSLDSKHWVPDPPNDPEHVRFRYDGPNPLVQEIEEYLSSSEVLGALEKTFNNKLKFSVLKFWVDTKMLLGPHVEQPNGNITMAQIYITNQEYPYLGTTMYQDNKKLLFQLPYRDNFGYCWEKSDEVMHGKICETPEGFNRKSLIIFFNKEEW